VLSLQSWPALRSGSSSESFRAHVRRGVHQHYLALRLERRAACFARPPWPSSRDCSGHRVRFGKPVRARISPRVRILTPGIAGARTTELTAAVQRGHNHRYGIAPGGSFG